MIIAFAIIILFLPIFFIGKIELLIDYPAEAKGGIVIGIGVILRATIRRLLRSSAQSMVRTSVGVSTRMSSRVMARRFVRLAVRMFGRIVPFSEQLRKSVEEVNQKGVEGSDQKMGLHIVNTIVGCLALVASLFGVLYMMADGDQRSVLGSLDIVTFSALGAIPMLVYLLVTPYFARMFNVRVHSELSLSALLLQGYFTGAGSFLPLTNDLSYGGEERQIAKLSFYNLCLLLILHLVFFTIDSFFSLYWCSVLSGMFLIYAFVFSFPMFPLEGHHVWKFSKWKWLTLFLIVIVLFNKSLGEHLFRIM